MRYLSKLAIRKCNMSNAQGLASRRPRYSKAPGIILPTDFVLVSVDSGEDFVEEACFYYFAEVFFF